MSQMTRPALLVCALLLASSIKGHTRSSINDTDVILPPIPISAPGPTPFAKSSLLLQSRPSSFLAQG